MRPATHGRAGKIRPLSSLLAALVTIAGCATGPDAPERPNVLLIVMDTARSDRLSSYGYPREITPNLDRLAAEGVLFENCITPGSWTLPSHASLFTGLFPRDHDTTCESRTLAGYFTTLAEEFRAAGYGTAGFSNNVWLSAASGLQQGFEHFDEVWRKRVEPDAGAARTNRRVLRWLDGRAEPADPFFVFINYFEPHLPYRPPPPYDAAYLPDGAHPAEVAEIRTWQHPREVGYILGVPGMEVTPRQFELLEAQYDGEMAYLDARIGELVRQLETRGLLDHTILVITSDHGEHFGDHGLMDHKMSLYDVLLRVPLIVRYPPRIAAGGRVEAQVQTIDLFPTLLRLAGLATGDEGLPLEAGDAVGREHAFAEFGNPSLFLEVMHEAFPGVDTRRFERSLKAVRTRRHKLIRASDGTLELYDIVEDPAEAHDLSQAHPEIVRQLSEVLDGFENQRGTTGEGG